MRPDLVQPFPKYYIISTEVPLLHTPISGLYSTTQCHFTHSSGVRISIHCSTNLHYIGYTLTSISYCLYVTMHGRNCPWEVHLADRLWPDRTELSLIFVLVELITCTSISQVSHTLTWQIVSLTSVLYCLFVARHGRTCPCQVCRTV